MHMNKAMIDKIALLLMIFGSINWGLVGLLHLDVVAVIFGSVIILQQLVYLIIGAAGVYGAVMFFRR